MNLVVFLVVVLSALLHASWNTLVKKGEDKTATMGAIVIGQIPLAILVLPFVSLPTAESLPYLLISIFLHLGYNVFLIQAYKRGDLTHVYPIARGFAPLLITFFSILVLGVSLKQTEILAVSLIGFGVISLGPLKKGVERQHRNATIFAMLTGLFIAAYSLVDGVGARLAKSFLGFYSLVTISSGLIMLAFLVVSSSSSLKTIYTSQRRTFLIGGTASFVAYSTVIWAFTKAPIALVTALREVSIIFALLFGIIFLKEKLTRSKVYATLMTVTGIILLKYPSLY